MKFLTKGHGTFLVLEKCLAICSYIACTVSYSNYSAFSLSIEQGLLFLIAGAVLVL